MHRSQFLVLLSIQIVVLLSVLCLYFKDSPLSVSPHKEADKILKVNYSGNYVIGNPNAKNELVIFTQFDCSFCRNFYLEMYEKLRHDYVLSGSLKIIFIHTIENENSSEYFKVKLLQAGKKNGLYESIQSKIYNDVGELDSTSMVFLARKLSLPSDLIESKKFNEDLSILLQRNALERQRLRINGTPTFILNGSQMVGYKGYDEFMTFFKSHIAETF
jgi:protein-disulfide isomerase